MMIGSLAMEGSLVDFMAMLVILVRGDLVMSSIVLANYPSVMMRGIMMIF